MGTVLLEARAFKPFKSGEEYLEAMKEDLAEWLQAMYPHLGINPENFMDRLETGIALCEHANAVKVQAIEYVEKKQAKIIMSKSITGTYLQAQQLISIPDVKYFNTARAGTFFSRDNVCNFINWCRKSLGIIECLLFESDDLIMRKNEKHVILCLLEVARRGAKFGMLAPMLVQMERQIDREIAADQKKCGWNDGTQNEDADIEDEEDSDMEDEVPVMMYGPVPQIVTNDLKSLDEMVRDLVAKCTCPTQFPMIRVSEGKYRIGDTRVLIFVRILRNHVMVRVGGGWDTLSHYLDKHDPCRCRSQHRTTHGAKLVNKPGAADLHGSQVHYDRSAAVPAANGVATTTGNAPHSLLGPPMNSLNRSRSRSPSQITNNRRSVSPNVTSPRKSLIPPPARSRSPTPNFTSTHQTKLKMSAKTSPKHEPKHVTSVNIPVNQKGSEVHQQTHVAGETDQSDTTSELSDEGYRSLGLVQEKNKQRSSVYSQNSAEDVEDTEHQIDAMDDLNEIGLRKTTFSQIFDGSPHHRPLATRSNSADPPPGSPRAVRKSVTKATGHNNTGTWNGRTKTPRASLTTDTFQPFSRHSLGRRSVSDVRRPSSNSLNSSANTSPTKTRLKQQIIETMQKAEDESVLVERIQQVLEQYRFGGEAEGATFGRGAHDRMSMRSPRRDTKPENQYSRIPAPVNKA